MHDYALWTLLDPAAAAIARGLAWAVMPDVIGQRAAAIVANMTCAGRSKLPPLHPPPTPTGARRQQRDKLLSFGSSEGDGKGLLGCTPSNRSNHR